MTVGELRKLLDGVPDDMAVFVPVEPAITGGFAFEEACPSISGVIEFGPPIVPFGHPVPEEEVGQGKAFLIAPHSFNPDHQTDTPCTLN